MSTLLLLLACAAHRPPTVEDVNEDVPGVSAVHSPVDAQRESLANTMNTAAAEAAKAGDFQTAKAVYARLRDDFADTAAGAKAGRRYDEVASVGTAAPVIAVSQWYQGVGDWAANPLTLVLFFETWCQHCGPEMPDVVALQAMYAPRGLGIVAFTKVSQTATDETVRAFIAKHKLTFPVGRELGGSMSTAFGVYGIPAAALVKDGVIVWRGHPTRLTEALITPYLSGPAAGR